jgi:chemotaxis protein MotB
MSAHNSNDRRRRRPGMGEGGHGDGERWLLTYADMITLLMALFIVMWSISVTNVSKFDELKIALKQAFSGKVFTREDGVLGGQRSILKPDGTPVETIVPQPPRVAQSFKQIVPKNEQVEDKLAEEDLENLQRIKTEIDKYAVRHRLTGRIRTAIDERGLVVRLVSDDLLFSTGEAELQPRSLPILRKVAHLLATSRIPNDVRVEGNTDNVPISTSEFQSNWELSTARATAVLQQLLTLDVPATRLAVAGYGDQRPVVPNTTAAGRQLNRRVDLVVLRRAVGRLDR